MLNLKNKKIKYLMPDLLKLIILQFYYFFKGLKYFWGNKKCPVCSMRNTSFLPINEIDGGKKFLADIDINGMMHSVDNYETFNVKDFICRVCGANDKARFYMLYVRKKLSEIKSGNKIKIIHFAPENGISNFLRWNRKLIYRSADLYRDDVDDCIDLMSMSSYQDSSFDAFICSHILEHVDDDEAALKELFRILKPGGWGILMVPILLSIDSVYEDPLKITPEERLMHFGLEDHLRVYSKSGFLQRVSDVGFIVNQYDSSYFGLEKMNLAGLSGTNVLYVVTKND